MSQNWPRFLFSLREHGWWPDRWDPRSTEDALSRKQAYPQMGACVQGGSRPPQPGKHLLPQLHSAVSHLHPATCQLLTLKGAQPCLWVPVSSSLMLSVSNIYNPHSFTFSKHCMWTHRFKFRKWLLPCNCFAERHREIQTKAAAEEQTKTAALCSLHWYLYSSPDSFNSLWSFLTSQEN